MLQESLKSAGEFLLNADDEAHKVFKPYVGWPVIKALGIISKVGDQPELRLISGSLIVTGIFSGSDRLVRAGARMMIAHEAATIVKHSLKTNIDRKRPRSAADKAEKKPRKGKHKGKELSSFPSGHSAGAIAAARAFSRQYPEYEGVAVGVATLIALAQIPRCAHYPTDVVAGLAIGVAAEAATNAAWNAIEMDERSRTGLK